MKCLLVAGGSVDRKQLSDIYDKMGKPFVVGVDRGVVYLKDAGIPVDAAIGDFDSISESERSLLKQLNEVEELCPVKDDTDTEHTIRYLVDRDFEEVVLLGCTGTRLDHTLDAIFLLKIFAEKGISAYILDLNNKIYVRKGLVEFKREEIFGKYISMLPYSDRCIVSEIRGFKYVDDNLELIRESGRGISNELLEETGYINAGDYIIFMETKD